MADGRMGLNIDTSKTLAATDSGIVQNVIADAVVITLPASASTNVGQTHIVRNGGAKPTGTPTGAVSDGSVGIVVTPASGDGVTGGAWTAAINKGVTFTKSTSRVGDEVSLVAGGANTAAAWQVERMLGASVGRTA
jgi:hypothetical protein